MEEKTVGPAKPIAVEEADNRGAAALAGNAVSGGGQRAESNAPIVAGPFAVARMREAIDSFVLRAARFAAGHDYVVALLAALAIRALFLGGNSLWSDEAFSVLWSQQSLEYLIGAGAQLEPNPPLYYVLLHAWMQAFGSSAEAVRSLSVVFSVLTVMATCAIGRLLLGRPAAIFAGIFAALDPASVFFAQEARAYSLLACLEGTMILALVCYARRVPAGRMRPEAWLAVFAAAAIAAAYTQYTAIVFVAGCFAAMTLHVAFAGPGAARQAWALFVSALVVALGSAYALLLAKSLAASAALTWIPPLSFWQIQTFLRSLLTYPDMRFDRAAQIACSAPLIALVASPSPLRFDRLQFGVLILLPALFVALAIAVSLERPILLPRIGLWLTIPLCLALARAVAQHRAARRRAAACVACLAAFAIALASYFADYRKEDWREAARLATTDPRCGGPVVFSDLFLPLLYYQPSIASRPFYTIDPKWLETNALQRTLTQNAVRPAVLDPPGLTAFLSIHPRALIVLRRGSEPLLEAAPAPAFRANLPGGLTVACY